MERKTFIQTGIGELGGLSLPSALRSKPVSTNPNPIDYKTIEEFVLVGDSDLAKVKEMVSKEPNLIYCRYDWGADPSVNGNIVKK